MKTRAYNAWRESEAYAVPMTEDGVKWSQERWRGFSTGYKQAMKDVVDLLMIQHEAAKGTHNYWHVAANLVKAEFLNERVEKEEQIRHEPVECMCGICKLGKRKWVGLTDDDMEQEFGFIDELLRDCVQRTEAKLKEKNT